MRMPGNHLKRIVCVIVGSCALVLAGVAVAQSQDVAILGVWRGTSLCTDLTVAPECKDERVIYTFQAIAGGPAGRVRLQADKVVGGEREPMGEMDFVHDGATGAWTSEFRNGRYHGLWSFTVTGNRINGTLVDVPTGKVVRRVAVTKD